MISKEEVEHIAKLSRLGLSPEEIGKIQKELSLILDYMEKLKEVDVSNVKPTSHSINLENVMREDKEGDKLKNKEEKLMELAPQTKEGYLKIKSVF